MHSKIISECLLCVTHYLGVGNTIMNNLDKIPVMELIILLLFFILEVFDF